MEEIKKEAATFRKLLFASGAFLALLVFFSFISLMWGSLLSISKFGFSFITKSVWDPVTEEFGILPFIVGTFLTAILSLLISLPFSISVALLVSVYLREGFLKRAITYLTDLLAGIPSVIYGLWALFSLVPIVRKFEMLIGVPPIGVGIFTASLVLAIMIIPYTSSIAREVIQLVPADLIEAGYSLGATRFDVIRKVILPYARSGIFAGILLAFGRAFGETMAVTMVIGNSNEMPHSIFDPANTMASVIANEFAEAAKDIHLSSLIQIGMWLFIFTFFINWIGNFLIKKFGVRAGR